MRFAFIAAHHSEPWPVSVMCEVLEVSRAGFYRWRQARASLRQHANDQLLAFLLARAQALGGIPGYRKLWLDAVEAGFACSLNRVHRLLQSVGYRSLVACRPGYRPSSAGLPVAPNLLARQFQTPAPNRVWVSDITQIRCEEGWLYVAVVIDLFARQVVGWSAGRANQSWLVLKALRQAWRGCRPAGDRLLFHSDQGSQYRNEAVMGWLTRRGVTVSMSRVGNCWDNACAESFFALLKKEWVRPLGLIGREEMHHEVGYYVEEYYPKLRRHTTLGGLTPAAFMAAA